MILPYKDFLTYKIWSIINFESPKFQIWEWYKYKLYILGGIYLKSQCIKWSRINALWRQQPYQNKGGSRSPFLILKGLIILFVPTCRAEICPFHPINVYHQFGDICFVFSTKNLSCKKHFFSKIYIKLLW